MGQQPARNAVGEQKIDVFLLYGARDEGFRGHLSVIRLQYSAPTPGNPTPGN
jgi:hypothetical protein